MEYSEWQPDLVITVFDSDGQDPWLEARTLLDPPASIAAHTESRLTTGFDYTTGHSTSVPTIRTHGGNIRHKIVDVIGSPFMLVDFPFRLRSNTKAFMPYYQSEFDAFQERSGMAEWLSRPIDVLAFTHPIGNLISHWGYAFPRSMTVDNSNNYKASIVAALHAADLVTNQNTLHTIQGVSNSCGNSCAIANVTEVTSQNGQVIWQEVYPMNINRLSIGKDDSLNANTYWWQ